MNIFILWNPLFIINNITDNKKQIMRLSNKKYVYRFSILILIVLFIIIVGYLVLLFCGSLDLFPHILVLYLIISIVLIITHIRCLEFDCSGHVISIKQYHPFDRKIHFPVAEFPNYKLCRFYIKKQFWIKILYIEIKTKKRNIIKQYPVYGYSRNKLDHLQQSLQDIIIENQRDLTP
ncbi:hypothetical protein SAMN05421825_1375 [Epilithonimonas hungarica]|uniref:DUF2244 domain-containing protein n=1 Tax=Epilithonimonas hungarica TaxID=454006 RepID=A0A1G7JGA5_9FLAO|nr:hypothetical protein SAMN05421825_1375 [Epilithonimonas hungarica]